MRRVRDSLYQSSIAVIIIITIIMAVMAVMIMTIGMSLLLPLMVMMTFGRMMMLMMMFLFLELIIFPTAIIIIFHSVMRSVLAFESFLLFLLDSAGQGLDPLPMVFFLALHLLEDFIRRRTVSKDITAQQG